MLKEVVFEVTRRGLCVGPRSRVVLFKHVIDVEGRSSLIMSTISLFMAGSANPDGQSPLVCSQRAN